MRLGRRLPLSFFARPCLAVARDLVGCVLVHETPSGERLAGRLVEVEAYLGDGSDPASHAHVGMTERNRSMFGPPGHLYAYRSYGIHTCINVVCEAEGIAGAVLLRAAEPWLGVARMRRNRGLAAGGAGPEVASGPGRLAQAFGLGLEHDGTSLIGGALRLHRPPHGAVPTTVATGPRVGISKAAGHPYRFYVADDPWVSAFRTGGRRRRAVQPAKRRTASTTRSGDSITTR